MISGQSISLRGSGLSAVLPEEQAEELRTLAAKTDEFLELHSCTVEQGWLAWATRLLRECAAATQVETEAGVQVLLMRRRTSEFILAELADLQGPCCGVDCRCHAWHKALKGCC